jgi:hypothetical protein
LVQRDEQLEAVLKMPGLAIGDEGFRHWVERLRDKALKARGNKQDTSFRRVVAPLKPEVVLEEVTKAFEVQLADLARRKRGSPLRPAAARCLVRFAGQTQRQAAEILGLGSGAAVSAQIKQLPQWEAKERKLRRRMAKLERVLEELQAAPGKPGDRQASPMNISLIVILRADPTRTTPGKPGDRQASPMNRLRHDHRSRRKPRGDLAGDE